MTVSGRPILLALALLVPAGAAAEAGGARDFGRYCAVCHGVDARGQGPYADKLRRPPTDLTVLSRKHGGVFPEPLLHRIVDGREMIVFHGPREMPIWGDRFRAEADNAEDVDARIAALVQYLESLQVE